MKASHVLFMNVSVSTCALCKPEQDSDSELTALVSSACVSPENNKDTQLGSNSRTSGLSLRSLGATLYHNMIYYDVLYCLMLYYSIL